MTTRQENRVSMNTRAHQSVNGIKNMLISILKISAFFVLCPVLMKEVMQNIGRLHTLYQQSMSMEPKKTWNVLLSWKVMTHESHNISTTILKSMSTAFGNRGLCEYNISDNVVHIAEYFDEIDAVQATLSGGQKFVRFLACSPSACPSLNFFPKFNPN